MTIKTANTIEALLADLKASLPENIILTDDEFRDFYSRDHTPDISAMPDIIIRAETSGHVQTVMKLCSKQRVPVVPRGAGTGVTGGAIPVQGGVVLSLEKMNRIVEIDTDNMTAVVEPGVITETLQNAALEHGLMYPPDPASLDSCSIGGNVSENAGGPRAVKYGTTEDYVLSLECVLPDGSLIETGGKYVKNATGYNLKGILIGSEGTLAVITRITLRLIPAPIFTADLLIPFDSLDDAITSVFNILKKSVQPSALEFMERDAVELTSQYNKGNIPFPDAEAHLLVSLDAQTMDELDHKLELFMEIDSIDHNTIVVADSGPQKEKIWKARRSIRLSIEAIGSSFFSEDCVVPRASIPRFVISLKEKLNERNLRSVMFGHAGDGNIHINILQEDFCDEEWFAMMPGIKELIYKEAISFQGNITGEHGTGFLRKEYLHLSRSKEEISLYRAIKKAFDPQNILNPGKIIPGKNNE